ncbi:hypothetical protein NHJ6243_006444 [Beauveria neobassiana]
MYLHIIPILLFPLLPSLITALLNCRADGPVLPKPTSLQNSPVFKSAAANLTKTLNGAINGSIAAGWAVENVSFSLAVVSLDQADPGIPIWEFHHQAKISVNGTKKIDRDSQYLIASIRVPANDFISHMIGACPITVPMERPAYSNAAFNVLAMALEAATGKNYTQMVKEMLSTNLGMKDTLSSPGCDNKAVIPSVESNWGTDFGYSAPSGGLVSTTSDLSKFTHRLLARSLGLITIYGKNGGSLGYRSQISVLDEYGIALIVLSAGAMNAQPLLTDAMLAQFVPAIDEVSRKQADHDYARYFGTNCNGGNSNVIANITFKQDIDSLTVSSFHLNGSDMLASIPEMWNLTMGQYSSPVGPKLRLFPSDMVKKTKVQHETLTSEMWLLWPELIDGERSDLPGAGLEHANCMTWTIGDWVHYGGQPIDRVLFYRDENGKVVGFDAPFLRTGILRP